MPYQTSATALGQHASTMPARSGAHVAGYSFIPGSFECVTLRTHNAIMRHNGAMEHATLETQMIDNGIPAVSAMVPDQTTLDAMSAQAEAVARAIPGNGRARRMAKRKARKAAERAAERAAQPSNGQRLAPSVPTSKATGKGKAHGRLDMPGVKASAEMMAKLETKQFLITSRAVKVFEGSTATKDAALAVVSYFGENVHKGIVRPLWAARLKSQRDAVAEVWNIGSDVKSILDSKVQLMIRLRVMGYGLLKIPVPVKGGGRPAQPIIDRAFGRVRNLLSDMDQAERGAFLARVRDAVKALNTGKKLTEAS